MFLLTRFAPQATTCCLLIQPLKLALFSTSYSIKLLSNIISYVCNNITFPKKKLAGTKKKLIYKTVLHNPKSYIIYDLAFNPLSM